MTITLDPLPMASAQKFWGDKIKLSPAQYAQLEASEKVLAFAVSGIAKGDELTTVYNSLRKAMDSGMPFNRFQEECREIFERRGWTGKAAWRVDNIFRTNIQTAYNVGRYKEMRRVKRTRPYWQYSAVNDSRTRPAHLAMNGRVFPADHPTWDTWYPPNGFRCRCNVITLSQREVDRDGLTVETEDPTNSLVEPIDPKTGNTMPARYLIPDPGFTYNPGKTVYGGIVDAADKTGESWKSLSGLKTPADYSRPNLADVKPGKLPDAYDDMLLPAGMGDDFYKAEFISRYGEEKVVKDVTGEPVILSLRSFLVDKTPGASESWKFDKPGHGVSIPVMESLLVSPYEVWLVPQESSAGRIRLTKRYIAIWKTQDTGRIGGLAVYEASDGVFQGVTNFTPVEHGKPDMRYLEKQREGVLLYGR